MEDINSTGLVPASSVSCQKLVDAFLKGRKPNTARAYAAGIEAFGAFLSIRGQRFDTAQGRLSGEGVRLIIRKLGRSAGLGRVRPHGLRHSAITNALDRGNDIRSVARFSRHKKLDTVIRYDDNRRDIAGDIARQNSEE